MKMKRSPLPLVLTLVLTLAGVGGFFLFLQNYQYRDREVRTVFSIEVGLVGIPNTLNTFEIKTLTEWTIASNLTRRILGGFEVFSAIPGIGVRLGSAVNEIAFNLNGDKKFSDGSPIMGQDFISTIGYLCTLSGPNKLPVHNFFSCKDGELNSQNFSIEVGPDKIEKVTIRSKIPMLGLGVVLNLPDFGILYRGGIDSGIVNRGAWKNWNVTSGDYFVSNSNDREVTLQKNPFEKFSGPEAVKLVEIRDVSDYSNWLASGTNRILRLPENISFPLPSGYQLTQGSHFWSRVGFVSPKSKVLNSSHFRKSTKVALRNIFDRLGMASDFQLLGENLPGPTSDSESIAAKNLTFLLSTFTIPLALKEKVTNEILAQFPGSTVIWKTSPKEFVEALIQKDFDVGIAQISFGSSDPLPALEYMKLVYLGNHLEASVDSLFQRTKLAKSSDERNTLLNEIAQSFEDESLLFGLGKLRAHFYHPENLEIRPEYLVSGELTFRSFLQRKSEK